jgi:N utilization substance protein B
MTDSASPSARARELVLLLLCHLESYRADERQHALEVALEQPPLDAPGELATLLADAGVVKSATARLRQIMRSWTEIDADVESASQRWRLARMDRVDRNVLRIATSELRDRTPPRGVVLSEAVRLAERYGSERSVVFVNGLAATLANRLRDGEVESPT